MSNGEACFFVDDFGSASGVRKYGCVRPRRGVPKQKSLERSRH